MKRINLIKGLCVLALVASIAPTAQAQGKPTVRYQEYGKIIFHLPDWVMIEKGYCDKHGIKCEPVTLANAPLAQAASAAGSVEIVNSTIDTSLQAISKGNDLQIVGGSWQKNPYVLAARADLTVPNRAAGYPANMAGLKGMKIGVTSRGSSAEMFVKALLAGAGMPADSVSYISVGAPVTAFAALAAKQVDAALTWDPVPALCAASGACNLLVDMRRGDGPPTFKPLMGTAIFLQAQRQYVEKYPERIDAYNRARADAVAWLKDPRNAAEALALAKKNVVLGESVPNREKVYELMVTEAIPFFTTTIERSSPQAWHDFLLANKVIDKPLPVESLIYRNAPFAQ